jgi:hypothetical protein
MKTIIKPIKCSCGGTPCGRGKCIACDKCGRVVQKNKRNNAVERWNEVVRLDFLNCVIIGK